MSLFISQNEYGTAALRLWESISFLLEFGSVIWLVAISLLSLRLIFGKSNKSHTQDSKIDQKEHKLFPSIENTVLNSDSHEEPLVEAFPQPCSTGLTTRLLPFKNDKGEIEWIFTDDIQPGQELDAFKADPGIFKAESNHFESEPSHFEAEPDHFEAELKFFKPTADASRIVRQDQNAEALSPVTSNSSNNESILEKKGESSGDPQINTPASTSSEDHKDEAEEEGLEEGQLHQCPHCNASFRMRGYLTRHLKKHMSEKAYQCPFREMSTYKDENDTTHKCHPSGGFSRRDTYKTHLKTRHFKFPQGTPLKGRSKSPGHCSMCGEWFQSAEIWSEIHVEGAECKYLPVGFQGKSRIKNKLKKQMVRLMKEEKRLKKSVKHSNIDTHSPGMGTPNMAITPQMSNPSQYEDSTSQSSCSPMGQQRLTHQSLGGQFTRGEFFQNNYAHTPLLEQSIGLPSNIPEMDYDDEFCLDTEQVCFSVPMAQSVQSSESNFIYNNFPHPEYMASYQTATYRNDFSGFTR